VWQNNSSAVLSRPLLARVRSRELDVGSKQAATNAETERSTTDSFLLEGARRALRLPVRSLVEAEG